MLCCAAIVVRLNVRGVRDVVKLIMYSWVSCLERQQLQKPNDEAGNEWSVDVSHSAASQGSGRTASNEDEAAICSSTRCDSSGYGRCGGGAVSTCNDETTSRGCGCLRQGWRCSQRLRSGRGGCHSRASRSNHTASDDGRDGASTGSAARAASDMASLIRSTDGRVGAAKTWGPDVCTVLVASWTRRWVNSPFGDFVECFVRGRLLRPVEHGQKRREE